MIDHLDPPPSRLQQKVMELKREREEALDLLAQAIIELLGREATEKLLLRLERRR